jgi:hypothetical protein
MNNVLLRWLVLAFGIGTLTVLLAGCLVPVGGDGYYDEGFVGGAAYYEPYGTNYGGWGPGYQVAPHRNDGYRPPPPGGGGHSAPAHISVPDRKAAPAYRPAPASRSTPSLPSRGGKRGGRGADDRNRK